MTTLPLYAPTIPVADALSREADLLERLAGMRSVVVAFSGGADSTYVAWAAREALGARGLAVTGVSASLRSGGAEDAAALAAGIGIAHELVETRELDEPRYRANAPDRCYHCKRELYQVLEALARDRGFAAVADGTNRDDLGDHRPGRRAASEHNVRSPLVEAGIAKADLRWLSRRRGLPTWDLPASPCLSSRVPHGTAIDEAMLAQVDRAEAGVRALGFRDLRVRHLGDRARVEVAADELERLLEPEMAERVTASVRSEGFAEVVLDREGLRSGRLSEESRREMRGR